MDMGRGVREGTNRGRYNTKHKCPYSADDPRYDKWYYENVTKKRRNK
jgi:hypothetical protein